MQNATIILKKNGGFSGVPSQKLQFNDFESLQIFCYRLAAVTMNDVKAIYFGESYLFLYAGSNTVLRTLYNL